MTDTPETPDIQVSVTAEFVASESDANAQQFVFSYDVEIRNTGERDVQLLRRYWKITQGSGEVQEIEGEGVVGEMPIIAARGYFSYQSRAVIDTDIGVMEGHYTFADPESGEFLVPIPPFRLAPPNRVH
ncbi:Co2+/Mg2+ efflux protein ApaG [Larsenimonas salina]|uniref:Co2+/Mg2+ efflux protein ApaG n=1 Tax=Larsenimonas salina TaxID=1295565 RepID=UPI002072BB72|nr:Co2+/Mg2+ efflux protein ApaG [Larsenimonas salina]MCM5703906.1 Co2+/Mg2+ efflux protein ApaG [Larsenimonas salina]